MLARSACSETCDVLSLHFCSARRSGNIRYPGSIRVCDGAGVGVVVLILYAIVNVRDLKRVWKGLGGGARVRTEDLLRAKQALSQLSYTPLRRHPGFGGQAL